MGARPDPAIRVNDTFTCLLIPYFSANALGELQRRQGRHRPPEVTRGVTFTAARVSPAVQRSPLRPQAPRLLVDGVAPVQRVKLHPALGAQLVFRSRWADSDLKTTTKRRLRFLFFKQLVARTGDTPQFPRILKT